MVSSSSSNDVRLHVQYLSSRIKGKCRRGKYNLFEVNKRNDTSRLMSSAAFSETLQFVTNVKLQELEKRRQAFGQHASKVLADAQKYDTDLIQKVTILLEGITSWPGLKLSDGNLNLDNIQCWLHQVYLSYSLF